MRLTPCPGRGSFGVQNLVQSSEPLRVFNGVTVSGYRPHARRERAPRPSRRVWADRVHSSRVNSGRTLLHIGDTSQWEEFRRQCPAFALRLTQNARDDRGRVDRHGSLRAVTGSNAAVRRATG